jgi:antibiotic biosynthesis monooxygenase (ABM) superfamily enzyme
VRCQGGQVEPFVYTQSAARMEPQDGDHTVRVAFDDGPEVTERWPDSDEHDALFAKDSAAFAQQLATAQTLRFAFEPHNAPPASARFDVSGLSGLLSAAAKPCGWKLVANR